MYLQIWAGFGILGQFRVGSNLILGWPGLFSVFLLNLITSRSVLIFSGFGRIRFEAVSKFALSFYFSFHQGRPTRLMADLGARSSDLRTAGGVGIVLLSGAQRCPWIGRRWRGTPAVVIPFSDRFWRFWPILQLLISWSILNQIEWNLCQNCLFLSDLYVCQINFERFWV